MLQGRCLTAGLAISTIATGLFVYGKATAFEATRPPPPFSVEDSTYLECAIVRHTPDRDRDPPYKINIGLRINNGRFEGLDVSYTLTSGRVVDRSVQYQNGRTWTSMPRTLDWYWAGTRGNVSNLGHLYHNERDGWMYTETITAPRSVYRMIADCHEMGD